MIHPELIVFYPKIISFFEFYGLFVVLYGYRNKNQRGLELKIILSMENEEEPYFISKPVFQGNITFITIRLFIFNNRLFFAVELTPPKSSKNYEK